MFRYIKKQEFLNGETGKVAFDESGDRMNAEYHVMNVHPGGKVARVGQYFYSSVSSRCKYCSKTRLGF